MKTKSSLTAISPSDDPYNPHKGVEEARRELTEWLDGLVVAGTVRAFEAQQMLQSLEERYQKWADGFVPEDILDDLIDEWHELEDDEISLHEFLRITWDQYIKAEQVRSDRADREARFKRTEKEYRDRVVDGRSDGPNRDYWLSLGSDESVRSEGTNGNGDPRSD